MSGEVHQFESALLGMDQLRIRSILTDAVNQAGRMQAIEHFVVPTMERIGLQWESGQLALAQVYMAGRLCEEAIESLLLATPSETKGPRIGLAVYLDHHQLGKRIVGSVLRSGGFEVIDYGAGQEAEPLAAKVRADRVPLLMVSVLMLHSALKLKDLRQALGNGPEVPILIAGGAPFRFDPTLGPEVGADAIGRTALDALQLARRFLVDPCQP